MYVLNLHSKVKFNKSTKETKYIKNHCDMLLGQAPNVAYVIGCTVLSDTLCDTLVKQPNHKVRYC